MVHLEKSVEPVMYSTPFRDYNEMTVLFHTLPRRFGVMGCRLRQFKRPTNWDVFANQKTGSTAAGKRNCQGRVCNAPGGSLNSSNPFWPARSPSDVESFGCVTCTHEKICVTAGGEYTLSSARTLSCVHPFSQLIFFSSAVCVCMIVVCVRP